ncbi:MAG: sugar phosphate isomerase/epimerase [Kiloniellales bacterium]|nr:sugar phosphate isomerase/epimerase [Kiloniellales bacterium]
MTTPSLIKGVGVSTMGGSPNMEALPDFLDRAASLGVDYVELSLCSEDIVAGGRILPDKLRRAQALIAGFGLGYTVHGPIAINFMDWRHLELHKQVCRAFVEVTAELAAELMVLHTGVVKATTAAEHERLHAIEREALDEMGEFANDHGIRLCVENVFVYGQDHYTADPAKLGQEIARLDHPNVAATLDFGHARIQTNLLDLDYMAACRALAPQVGHFHVHDCFGTPKTVWTFVESEDLAYGLGDLHLPLGWGEMDWDTLFPSLRPQPGTIMMLEIKPRYWSELAACVVRARELRTLFEEQLQAA